MASLTTDELSSFPLISSDFLGNRVGTYCKLPNMVADGIIVAKIWDICSGQSNS